MGLTANSMAPDTSEVHGTNPQRIVEKILRTKVYATQYWKEHCFGLTAETLVDRAIELSHIGGTYGGTRKPTRFMCLMLKMLQIQPDLEIVVEFIKNEEYKYVRVLGALYLRCVGRPADIYSYLEPLYVDYSKLRVRTFEGWTLTHVDEFVDELLTEDYSCDIALPHLPKRWHLEQQNLLGPRTNNADGLDDDDDDDASSASSERSAKKPERGRLVMKRSGRSESPRRDRKKKKADADAPPAGDGGDLDIEATNALRAKLGLKPLRP
jgi:pre-mRNA-splicing factor 38A